MGRRSFAVHRWLGVFIGIQLLLWSVGGLIFSTHSISWVRGNDGRQKVEPRPVALDAIKLTPTEAAVRAGVEAPREVVLRRFLEREIYEVRGDPSVLVDATTGQVLSPLNRETATRIATDDRVGNPEVVEITLLEKEPPTEYREGELPAWRIALRDADNIHIYVSAATGKITARRNDAWRRFDFFWMLHTMDYAGRDDFNHPLLIAASLVAVFSVLSGWFLWGLRLRRRMRRRQRT